MAKIVWVDLNSVLEYSMGGEKKAEEKAEFINGFRNAQKGSIANTTALTVNPSTLKRWGEIAQLNGVIAIKHKKQTFAIRVAEDSTEYDHKTLRKAFVMELKHIKADIEAKAQLEAQKLKAEQNTPKKSK